MPFEIRREILPWDGDPFRIRTEIIQGLRKDFSQKSKGILPEFRKEFIRGFEENSFWISGIFHSFKRESILDFHQGNPSWTPSGIHSGFGWIPKDSEGNPSGILRRIYPRFLAESFQDSDGKFPNWSLSGIPKRILPASRGKSIWEEFIRASKGHPSGIPR